MSEQSAQIRAEFEANRHNGQVGSVLVSETDRVRVWHIRLAPGERLPVHCHVLNYFWTAVTPGRARSNTADGQVLEVSYAQGETRHMSFASGEFMMHDLQNIGEDDLIFTTVEFKDSANEPLSLH